MAKDNTSCDEGGRIITMKGYRKAVCSNCQYKGKSLRIGDKCPSCRNGEMK